jgi:hypothetical protein
MLGAFTLAGTICVSLGTAALGMAALFVALPVPGVGVGVRESVGDGEAGAGAAVAGGTVAGVVVGGVSDGAAEVCAGCVG